MVELVNNIENLEFIIAKAREYDVQVPATDEDSGSNASDDNEVDILDASLTNPTRKELFAAIRSLNIDERQELLALMWVGRGDFSVDEWDEALSTAADRDNGREAKYLIGTPLLGDYLEEGLAALGVEIEAYDNE
ncbi:DUF3775 domain-containing protein [Brucella intermedia]|uniref:DUF3775 domain-containing protein n=4 Tax=Brucella/Ochrobactrum group TaxID=2826938 RepID=U4V110_9HYPH|nr:MULTISPECIES: DUF3775 domain-containing protein [Brucella/Ochrobactrum group]ERI13344.1 hypothetical protein O206_07720 [Ochrobactrum sp. EGD-AQ16]ERL99684.1 hypothetical protein Q644_09605 [Brucella intermedia 229E]MCH6202357.1 DUF3775 domain-containing protein [Brucella ciceri]PJT22870.1 DUF3775 domain-containing protein [Ochrobactrum sp. 30A/1000/2015]PJT37731.1 DUF3775 domain-containing protein [Ochrobactrum sp. 27A/999/2015]PJT42578.1 DUF3775 domain-containing protein [Ochrobactrum sp